MHDILWLRDVRHELGSLASHESSGLICTVGVLT
jgi:hypothetical protein